MVIEPKRIPIQDRDWKVIQQDYDTGQYWTRELCKKHGFGLLTLKKATKLGLFQPRKCFSSCRLRYAKGITTRTPQKHTEETRKRVSSKRKEYLEKHPEAFHWRSANKFKSAPCEAVKQWLIRKGFNFVEEHPIPETKRYFRLDIAFPSHKLAIEVNGSQHYTPTGELKPYYAERHKIIEEHGWSILELYYKHAFNENKLNDLLPKHLTPLQK